jgi:uncharacterized protein involved in exopolysaccharide biosynthesis
MEPLVYIRYVRSRWRFVALAFLAALTAAAAISLALPRQYTATARIVIEPPAGADPRAATAVSPIYLESLKTYEEFAASDSLFRKAADQFKLKALSGDKPFETLKKSVLKVGIVRNTRILEIAATLPDPSKAQALAQYIAEQTVSLNTSLLNQGAEELIAAIDRQARDARAEFDRDSAVWARTLTAEPVESLQTSISEAADLRAKLKEEAGNARLEIADAGDREKQASASEAELLRREQSNARARLSELEKQIADLDRRIAENEALLGQRQARREEFDARKKAAQGAVTAIESRLRDARNDLGYRGERLTIVDPGVVPERPSSPRIALNLLAAALLGLLFPLIYLALALQLRQHGAPTDVVEALARARDA